MEEEKNKYHEALWEIRYIIKNIGDQRLANINMDLARKQDEVLKEIWDIIENILKQ